MTDVSFTVPFAPVPWQRAGVRWTNRGPRHYTMPETRAWEETVAVYARSAMRGLAPFSGPVGLDLQFSLAIPAGWAIWKREYADRGDVAPTVKPDLDNLEKAVKDSLNGIAWVDDAQVVRVQKTKVYAAKPGVRIEIVQLAMFPAQISRRPHV